MAHQAFLAAQARRYEHDGEGADLKREGTQVAILEGKTGDALMRALQRNKDRLKKLFDVWDADGDGHLTLKEVSAACNTAQEYAQDTETIRPSHAARAD